MTYSAVCGTADIYVHTVRRRTVVATSINSILQHREGGD
jgi:hypothetical protein